MARTGKKGKKLKEFFKQNSLTIALLTLFLLAFAGEIFSGWNDYNDEQRSHHERTVAITGFLATGTFWDGTFCNWQAAILQLAVLIVFSEEFYQRGASHSRQPQQEKAQHGGSSRQKSTQHSSQKPEAHKGRRRHHRWFYRNSLALAFWAFFLVLFALHLVFGARAYNESRATQHLPPLNLWDFTASAKFWFLTFQTWEAEFFAIAVFIVLTIFLRQEKSPESKSPDATDRETGRPNE